MAERVPVWFDPSAEGITEKSLRNLRDIIVETYGREVALFQVQTDDLCCGFLFIERRSFQGKHQYRGHWTGDGFRLDGGGEGGAGFEAARRLFEVFGMAAKIFIGETWTYNWSVYLEHEENMSEKRKSLEAYASECLGEVYDADFFRPASKAPAY